MLKYLDMAGLTYFYNQLKDKFATKTDVGTPLKATTVAGMADTSKVYVYIGSETGYTSGHWYYYDSGSWHDGGAYNSAAIVTDKTLSEPDEPADAKVVGSELTDLKSAIDFVSDVTTVTSTVSQLSIVSEETGTINRDGSIYSSNSAYKALKYAVTQRTIYYVRGQYTWSYVAVAFYDSNDVCLGIKGYNDTLSSDFTTFEGLIKTPANCAYMKVSKLGAYNAYAASTATNPILKARVEALEARTIPNIDIYLQTRNETADAQYTGFAVNDDALTEKIRSYFHPYAWNDANGYVPNNNRLSMISPLKFGFPVSVDVSEISYIYNLRVRTFTTNTDLPNNVIGYTDHTGLQQKAVIIPSGVFFSIELSKASNRTFEESERDNIKFSSRYLLDDTLTKENEVADAKAVKSAIVSVQNNTNVNIANASGVDVIPDYYFENDYLPDKITDVLANVRDAAQGVSFVWITDVHLKGNEGKSASLIKYILDKTGIPFALCGGDIGTAYSTVYGEEESETISEADNWLAYMNGIGHGRMFCIRGNHDHNKQSADGAGTKKYWAMSDNATYAYITKPNEMIIDAEFNANYYYIDNPSQKVRFIVLDEYKTVGTTGTENKLTQNQVDWILDAINVENYTFVFASHQTFNDMLSNTDEEFEPIQQLMTAINNKTSIDYSDGEITIDADFTNTTNVVACHISGHSHKDESDTKDNVLSISCGCDMFAKYDDMPTSEARVRGTITEQLFDVVSIDTANRTIKTVRIGNGSDRSFTY